MISTLALIPSALVIAIFGMIAGVWGGQRRNTRPDRSRHNAVVGVAILVSMAAAILVRTARRPL